MQDARGTRHSSIFPIFYGPFNATGAFKNILAPGGAKLIQDLLLHTYGKSVAFGPRFAQIYFAVEWVGL